MDFVDWRWVLGWKKLLISQSLISQIIKLNKLFL